MFENFVTGRTDVDGTDIAYVMGGAGVPQLAQNYTVVCADLRGYGDSGELSDPGAVRRRRLHGAVIRHTGAVAAALFGCASGVIAGWSFLRRPVSR